MKARIEGQAIWLLCRMLPVRGGVSSSKPPLELRLVELRSAGKHRLTPIGPLSLASEVEQCRAQAANA